MSTAREAVFASIRKHLAGVQPAQPVAPRPCPGAPRDLDSARARLARFREVLEGVGGVVHVVGDEAGAAQALQAITREVGAREVALSDAPIVRELAASLDTGREQGVTCFEGWADRERLVDCDLGITAAQWGVAETGSLVLFSSSERHRLVSLVPPVHACVLEGGTILPALGDALDAARAEDPLPHLVTLITGPSRTADIELTLVVGVHGPKALHVVVIDR